MDAMRYIVAEQICELRREAKSNRMLRVVPNDDEPVLRQPSWPTRARRRIGDTLVAAGETLRSSAEESYYDRAA